jgi:hypothetical protein
VCRSEPPHLWPLTTNIGKVKSNVQKGT